MVCDACKKEMTTAKGCVAVPVEVGKRKFKPIPWDGDGRCHDCAAQPGHYHHPGCDMERCPKCGGQIISCGCLD